MEKLPKEKHIKTSVKYECDFLSVHEDDVVLPNGKDAKRVVVKHIGAAAVLPVKSDGNVLLVKQHRYVAGIDSLEIPAGKKDAPDEDGLICAKRELEEETGYTAKHFKKIQDVYTAIGFSDERIEIFVATNVTKLDEAPPTDEDEFVELVEMPLADAIEMAQNGKIKDAKTALALLSLNR